MTCEQSTVIIYETASHTVLDHLLALNRQGYEEEVKTGLHDKGAKKGKAKKAGVVESDLFH